MRAKVNEGVFDSCEYVRAEHISLCLEAEAEAWVNRQARRYQLGDISLSYFGVTTNRVRTYLIPFFGKFSIKDIREGRIQDVRLSLPEHLKASSVREILGSLRTILKEAYARRDIGRIPAIEKLWAKLPK
jgi:hypothetical protein